MRGDPEFTSRSELLILLATRLERLSVDSIWARRASGLRGSLLKAIEAVETVPKIDNDQLDILIDLSFEILKNAAREIPDYEEQWHKLK